ncbi:hypothetical protein PGT21_031989 [Puccinia graminis f. sp. tritici]|uniref:Uncharacterized protein n=1 Tax=Puccinia graminis f. sp. tritici TaxID=56615 RepID=A0A5B0QPL0_PUCGR|nr:hypothetical protein PGT21_031989 [Puccinia graminis f. sp. tritici]
MERDGDKKDVNPNKRTHGRKQVHGTSVSLVARRSSSSNPTTTATKEAHPSRTQSNKKKKKKKNRFKLASGNRILPWSKHFINLQTTPSSES